MAFESECRQPKGHRFLPADVPKVANDSLPRHTKSSPIPTFSLDAKGKFPRAARILRSWEFRRVRDEGVRVHTPSFIILMAAQAAGESSIGSRGRGGPAVAPRPVRLGLTISKKVGSAVVRNRLRRLIREIFRRLTAQIPPLDLVIIAKEAAASMGAAGLDTVASELLPGLKMALQRLNRHTNLRGKNN